jgi:putative membrane protein
MRSTSRPPVMGSTVITICSGSSPVMSRLAWRATQPPRGSGIRFRREAVHTGILHTPSEIVPALRLWSFCQGFYNLFLAAGTFVGVALLHSDQRAAGAALVLYTCAFMVGCGIVLFVADRRHLDGALGQALPPLGALVAAAF